ncbi:MAG: DUF4160 domain-containing protein [Sulfobacillus sp.]
MSPTVLIEQGFRFRFYSSDMGEPPHIHAVHHSGSAKIWLVPVSIARSSGLSRAQERQAVNIVSRHHQELMEAWQRFAERGGPDLDR